MTRDYRLSRTSPASANTKENEHRVIDDLCRRSSVVAICGKRDFAVLYDPLLVGDPLAGLVFNRDVGRPLFECCSSVVERVAQMVEKVRVGNDRIGVLRKPLHDEWHCAAPPPACQLIPQRRTNHVFTR